MSLDYASLLGDEAESLLNHKAVVPASSLHLPGPDHFDSVWGPSDRSPQVLRSLQALHGHGRLANTGYLSILPVDQGIEHATGASFAKNPEYFDGENIVKLAIEGGCNAVATTFALSGLSRKIRPPHPIHCEINHNELLTMPNQFDQVMFGSVRDAWNLGAVAVGATIYFGSDQSRRQIIEVAEAFEEARELGMATILWCYLPVAHVQEGRGRHHVSADLSGQANHLGVTIKADIIKQKQPEQNGGYAALNAGDSAYGKFDDRIYSELASDHPIDLTRYQVLNCYAGRAGLINSGGGSGDNDFGQAVRTVVINNALVAWALFPAAKPSNVLWTKGQNCSRRSRCLSR